MYVVEAQGFETYVLLSKMTFNSAAANVQLKKN